MNAFCTIIVSRSFGNVMRHFIPFILSHKHFISPKKLSNNQKLGMYRFLKSVTMHLLKEIKNCLIDKIVYRTQYFYLSIYFNVFRRNWEISKTLLSRYILRNKVSWNNWAIGYFMKNHWWLLRFRFYQHCTFMYTS